MQQRSPSENQIVVASDCGQINTPWATLSATDRCRREGSLEYQLVKKGSSVCCMEHGHSYPPSSCLPVFNTDCTRAGCNDSLLGDTCAPEYLEKEQLLTSESAHFCYKYDSPWKLFDLINTQVQEGHYGNCLAITRKL